MAGPATTVPIGVYRTPGVDIAKIEAYEAFLHGRRMDYVLSFTADRPSWSQFEGAILPTSTNGGPGTHSAVEWAPVLDGRELVLAVPACVQNTSWTDESKGVNDKHWKALTKTLMDGGIDNCVLRIAREFTGGWYPWSAYSRTATVYRLGYERIVNTMRDAGFQGRFMWNPYLGKGTFGPTDVAWAYPGDPSVDIIALDFYDGPDSNYPPNQINRSPAQQQAAWNHHLNQVDGLNGWLHMARSRGKQLAFPEWGLRLWKDGGVYKGGGDDAILVNSFADWMRNAKPIMHGFWEDHNAGVSDPDNSPGRVISVPNARAAFLNKFSS